MKNSKTHGMLGLRAPHSPSEYPSFLLYLLDQTHVTITAATAFALLSTRSADVLYFSTGALTSSLSAKGIKHLIRSPRPPPDPSALTSPIRPKRTFGMPSTHSSALTFYALYLLPWIPQVARHPLTRRVFPFLRAIRESRMSRWLDSHGLGSLDEVVLGLGVVGYWLAGLWSRVELGYHTWAQVAGGVGWGVGVVLLWRGLWSEGLRRGLQGMIDEVWRRTFGRVWAQ